MSDVPQGPQWFQAADGKWYPPAPPPGSWSGLAIASMVLGIVWVYWVGSVLAVIFAHIALRQMRANPTIRGRGMAIAGMVLGYVGLGLLGLAVLFGVLSSL